MSKAEDILEKFRKSLNAPSTKDEKIKVVLICIVISTTFWFFNALNKNDYVTRINYPVSIQFDQDKFVATESLPNRIPIEVSGGGWDLMARYFGLKMNTLNVSVDPAEQKFILTSTLRPEITPGLEPISINYFLQDSIRLKIEPKVTSEVVLAYDTSRISLDQDYVMASQVRLNPATISITGPQSMVEEVGDTLWLSEEIDGVTEDFSDEINLPELPDLISVSNDNVDVSFLVVRLFTIDVTLPIEARGFPDEGWALSPSSAKVFYKVPETSFDVTDTSEVRLFVNFSQMNRQDSSLMVSKEVLNDLFREVTVEPQIIKAVKND
ncbi:hypothetical protein [Roseivirga sp.]|uniref:hypothetical protein n=1 Tax=Roseivirga sp. TaxID=1964215 RepID=UPI003B521D93